MAPLTEVVGRSLPDLLGAVDHHDVFCIMGVAPGMPCCGLLLTSAEKMKDAELECRFAAPPFLGPDQGSPNLGGNR